jgi:hypothetical protein
MSYSNMLMTVIKMLKSKSNLFMAAKQITIVALKKVFLILPKRCLKQRKKFFAFLSAASTICLSDLKVCFLTHYDEISDDLKVKWRIIYKDAQTNPSICCWLYQQKIEGFV